VTADDVARPDVAQDMLGVVRHLTEPRHAQNRHVDRRGIAARQVRDDARARMRRSVLVVDPELDGLVRAQEVDEEGQRLSFWPQERRHGERRDILLQVPPRDELDEPEQMRRVGRCQRHEPDGGIVARNPGPPSQSLCH